MLFSQTNFIPSIDLFINVEVKNKTLVATFQDQGTAPTYGGTLNYGAITGSLTDNDNPIAAGTYTQPLTFTITVENRKH